MGAVSNEPFKPKVFIASSSEAQGVVDELVGLMGPEGFEPHPWDQIFGSGAYTFDALLDEVKLADAAVFIFAKDDELGFRGEATYSARDNVVLEYGLFSQGLGRDRVLILEEEGVRLPSDVLGIVTDQFPSSKMALPAALRRFVRKAKAKWADLPVKTSVGSDTVDAGLGYIETLRREQCKLEEVVEKLRRFSSESSQVDEPVELGSTSAAVSAYAEALSLVQDRFWTTTFLSSGFWTRPQGRVLDANRDMLARVHRAGGEARRLFLLDQPPNMVVDAYRVHRVLQRQLKKYDELELLAEQHRQLRRNMQSLLGQGFKVRAVFDENGVYANLPDAIVADPKDSEIAIYDDFRLDVFEGGSQGVIRGVKSYSPMVSYFDAYLREASDTFDELWAKAQPMEEFIEELQEAADLAHAQIDYESNWLAIYEYALSEEDERLKTIELARVEEVIDQATKEQGLKIRRYLDVGTCTGRYPINLRECVAADGEIVGVDEDYDCVRFAQANIERSCPDETRIHIVHQNFAARRATLKPPFDIITCMLGTLSHFGWDTKPTHDDSMQRALERMAALLAHDGLLFLGTWSEAACAKRNLLGIYRESDKERLAKWTPTLDKLDERLAEASLAVVDRAHPRRIDITWCRRAV